MSIPYQFPNLGALHIVRFQVHIVRFQVDPETTNAMTKFIVNNRTDGLNTDVNLFFAMTNCQIVHPRSLTHRINYKFLCLSAYGR